MYHIPLDLNFVAKHCSALVKLTATTEILKRRNGSVVIALRRSRVAWYGIVNTAGLQEEIT